MQAAVTAPRHSTRPAGTSEHQKATYRVLVLGILALLGPSAFGLRVGGLSIVYSALLMTYALWALRLTVVFHDDDSLGYILTVFDVVLTIPLVLWGEASAWVASSLGFVWVVGFVTSVMCQHRDKRLSCAGRSPSVDAATGFLTAGRFACSVDQDIQLATVNGRSAALIALRVLRYEEFVACHGAAAADRAMSALARRARIIVGTDADGFRLRGDTLVLVVAGLSPSATAEAAAALSQAANSRLIEGRRVDSFVGYALSPRDGSTPEELLRSALDPGVGRASRATDPEAHAAGGRRAASSTRSVPAARSLAV